MKILVTGGGGYMGSVASHVLLQQGHEIFAVDSLKFGGDSVLALGLNKDFHFIQGDIGDPELDRLLPDRFDAVVHLAAIVGDPACAREPDLARKINLDGALHIYQLSRKWNAERFIFASTCSNYGRNNETLEGAKEESELQPLSLYAETKVEVERALLDSDVEDGPRVTVLRFATLFGLSPRMRFDLTVNEFTMELMTRGALEVYGEQFWRPYIHVADAARAIGLVLESPLEKVEGQVFNTGDTGQNFQKGQLVERIRSLVPRITSVEYVHRDEDPRNYRVSFQKIKDRLGFGITRTVDDGIEEIIDAISKGIFSDYSDSRYRN
jgi:nucleoside-diphosphate-sugar epimerase